MATLLHVESKTSTEKISKEQLVVFWIPHNYFAALQVVLRSVFRRVNCELTN